MSSKWVLDTVAMQEDFFENTALIGIASTLPVYRLCWLLNKHFGTAFLREPDLDISIPSPSPEVIHYFPIYQYTLPLCCHRHLLYQLKSMHKFLLPEVKQLDYLWLVQDNDPEKEAHEISSTLKTLPEVQLSTILQFDKLKNLANLLI
jgi:hypothetical protein